MPNIRVSYCATLHVVVMDQNQTKNRIALLRVFQYRDFRVLGLNAIFGSFGGVKGKISEKPDIWNKMTALIKL